MAPIVAATVAAIAAIFAALMSMRTARLTHADHKRSLEMDFRRQQLNDLYGPIHMKQRTSIALRGLLPWKNQDGSKWRLVDHIEELKQEADPTKLSAISEVIRINEEIADLLTKHSGLYLSFPPPETLGNYIAHTKLLSIAWRDGRNEDPTNRFPFPDDFDDVIEDAIFFIRGRLTYLGYLPPDESPTHRLGEWSQ